MKLEGVVTNVTAFGAFVDIGVHQDGLVHISQLSDKKFVKHPMEVVSVGDVVEVKVLSVDLLGELYSLQYFSNTISHYHEYWDQIFSEVNESRLQQYFEKFKIAFLQPA